MPAEGEAIIDHRALSKIDFKFLGIVVLNVVVSCSARNMTIIYEYDAEIRISLLVCVCVCVCCYTRRFS